MTHSWPTGTGLGWRAPLSELLTELAQPRLTHPPPGRADPTADRPRLGFSEVIAETVHDRVPPGLEHLVKLDVPVVAHGVSLGLAGADRPDRAGMARLASAVEVLGAPLASEHVAFVRAGAGPRSTHPGGPGDSLHADVLEAGHLVPGPRTRESLDVLVENVREVMDALPVPLAMENPAGTLRWPEDELDEPAFLTELVERTGCWLLLDLHNLYVSCRAAGTDPARQLARMPLERVAYVHIAGGAERGGVYLDTHAHDVPVEVFALLDQLRASTGPTGPGVLLERDDNLDPEAVRRQWLQIAASGGQRVVNWNPDRRAHSDSALDSDSTLDSDGTLDREGP